MADCTAHKFLKMEEGCEVWEEGNVSLSEYQKQKKVSNLQNDIWETQLLGSIGALDFPLPLFF